MHQAGSVEVVAVPASDIDRRAGTFVFFQQLSGQAVPFPVLNAAVAQFISRHHSCRKQQDRTVILQVLVNLLDTADIAHRRIIGQNIHADKYRRQFGDQAQQLIRQHLQIRPILAYHLGNCHSFKTAQRMIGNDQHGPSLRDLIQQLLFIDRDIDTQRIERMIEKFEGIAVWRATIVDPRQRFQTQQAFKR